MNEKPTETKRFIRCKRCGILNFVWYRGPETGFRFELYHPGGTFVKNGERYYNADLDRGAHRLECVGQKEQHRDLQQQHDGGSQQQTSQQPKPETDRDFDGEGQNHTQQGGRQEDSMNEQEQTQEQTSDESLSDAIAKAVKDKIKSGTDEKRVEEIARKVAREVLDTHTQKVTTIVLQPRDTSQNSITIDDAHCQTPELLFWIERNVPVMLWGKPGASKSYTCHQVANALALGPDEQHHFGYISLNPQTPESRLFGFKDANGVYRETPFYGCYVRGGVFMIDEIDNSSDALLTSLNGAIANNHCAFPDGLQTRHTGFRLVATANTPGRGGDRLHAGRRPLDAATLDRFVSIVWEYDTALETKLAVARDAKNGAAWAAWVQRVRAYVEQHSIALVVSPRASMHGAVALKDSAFTVPEIAQMVLFKGLDRDTVTRIVSAVPYPTVVS